MSSMVVVSSFLLRYATSLFMSLKGASLKSNIHITSHRRKKHHHSKILSRLDYFGLLKSASHTNVYQVLPKIQLLNTVIGTTILIFNLKSTIPFLLLLSNYFCLSEIVVIRWKINPILTDITKVNFEVIV